MNRINLFPDASHPSHLRKGQLLRFIEDQKISETRYNHWFELINDQRT